MWFDVAGTMSCDYYGRYIVSSQLPSQGLNPDDFIQSPVCLRVS